MKLYVKTINRGNVIVHASPDASVESLKYQLESVLRISHSRIKLAHSVKGKEIIIEDQYNLEFYGIEHRTCLTLIPDDHARSTSESSTAFANVFNESSSKRTADDVGQVSQISSDLVQFFEAWAAGNVDYVKLWVSNEETFLTSQNEKGWNGLQIGAYFGKTAIVRFFLNQPLIIPSAVTEDGQFTALHLSCLSGHYDATEMLLYCSLVDIDYYWESYGTPLHCACISGNSSLVEMLLQFRANPSVMNGAGKTPIDLNVSSKIRTQLYRYLGEPDEAPQVFSSLIFWAGIVYDSLTWGLLLPIDGTFQLYEDKESYINKETAQLVVNLKDVVATQKTKTANSSIGKKYYFNVRLMDNTIHVFYTYDEELTIKWCESLFVAFLYQKSLENKARTTKASPVKEEEPENKMIEGFQSPISKQDFEIQEEIGKGSFSKVLLSKRKDTEEMVALKKVSKAHLFKQGYIKNAQTENQILRKLDHPFIIKLYDTFETQNSLYFVLEYCSGGNLETLLKNATYLSQEKSIQYIAQVILAIEELHDNDLKYRDLKPANILLAGDDYLRLTDFGQAMEDFELSKSFVGSPPYLSPEMLTRKGIGKPADVYQIGCVFYEMLAGYPPYYSDRIADLFSRIKYAKLKFPKYVSFEARGLCTKMLSRDPAERPSLSEIKEHELFEGINWEKLLDKEIESNTN